MKITDKTLRELLLPKTVGCMDSKTGVLEENYQEPQTPIVERIRRGLPMREFLDLQKLLSLPEEAVGKLLGMSNATLHRRKKSGPFSPAESERLVRFMRLFGLAMEVFESEDATRSWLKAENPGTAYESPLSYADTEYGAREVEKLLGRIDYGVFG